MTGLFSSLLEDSDLSILQKEKPLREQGRYFSLHITFEQMSVCVFGSIK